MYLLYFSVLSFSGVRDVCKIGEFMLVPRSLRIVILPFVLETLDVPSSRYRSRPKNPCVLMSH